MKAEKVYETSEMPDHKPTTKKIWLGMFSGLIIYLAMAGICFAKYYADQIDELFKYIAVFLFRHPFVSFTLLLFVSASLIGMIVSSAKKNF